MTSLFKFLCVRYQRFKISKLLSSVNISKYIKKTSNGCIKV